MNQADPPSSRPQGIVIPGSHRLVMRLSWLHASLALLVLLLLSAVLLPAGVLPHVHALAAELLAGGLAALVLSGLLLALTGLLATLLLTRARYRYSGTTPEATSWWQLDPGASARRSADHCLRCDVLAACRTACRIRQCQYSLRLGVCARVHRADC
jgi:hypothetical protein